MLSESFVMEKRLEFRDYETRALLELIEKCHTAIGFCQETGLMGTTCLDIVEFLNILEDEMSDRRKSGRAFDDVFGKKASEKPSSKRGRNIEIAVRNHLKKEKEKENRRQEL